MNDIEQNESADVESPSLEPRKGTPGDERPPKHRPMRKSSKKRGHRRSQKKSRKSRGRF